jgi:hypothetical protein
MAIFRKIQLHNWFKDDSERSIRSKTFFFRILLSTGSWVSVRFLGAIHGILLLLKDLSQVKGPKSYRCCWRK